ncbi:hypothetical protein CgunFtcFv8_016045 [Champsocephalus gunnari]|nr:hypothetical protein CgunFtcFv8_016045 [Champsocephalus gunnari]
MNCGSPAVAEHHVVAGLVQPGREETDRDVTRSREEDTWLFLLIKLISALICVDQQLAPAVLSPETSEVLCLFH